MAKHADGFTVTKLAAGSYRLEGKGRTVDVTYMPHLRGWVSQDQHDRYACSDPIETKAQCLAEAKAYINERVANPSQWR